MKKNPLDISIRPLKESDLQTAEEIFRLAFGTFLGVPEPSKFSPDKSFIRTRWHADHTASFGAEFEGRLVGSNMATRWGSVGFLGPLTILPDFWNRGIARLLMAPAVKAFDSWGCRHAGLFTFAESRKHIGLYQQYGFWPRFLTTIMSRPVQKKEDVSQYTKYSDIPEDERQVCLIACRDMTHLVFGGLDLEHEIRAAHSLGLGDTVLIRDGGALAALAVCHLGSGSEAGSDSCYVKFGAVRPGMNSGAVFDRLLEACESLAAEKGMSRLVAGVNTARHRAYERIIEQGFTTDMFGIIMQRPNEPAYNLPEIYLIDDWR